MRWEASCHCFFGLLRSGELVCPTDITFDPCSYLLFADIAIDSQCSPSAILVRIKVSKMDPFRQGVTLYIVQVDGSLCPVAAVLSFIVATGNSHCPLYNCEVLERKLSILGTLILMVQEKEELECAYYSYILVS